MATQADTKELRVLFPGSKIPVQTQEGSTIDVWVFPHGVGHIRKFKEAMERVFVRIGALKLAPMEFPEDLNGMTAQQWAMVTIAGAKNLPQIALVVIDELLDLLAECVKGIDIKSTECPIWVLPEVALAWLMETFGDEKKARPWINMVEQNIKKTTGTDMGLWELLSKRSSAQATPSTSSSTTSSSPSPTPDGASLSLPTS